MANGDFGGLGRGFSQGLQIALQQRQQQVAEESQANQQRLKTGQALIGILGSEKFKGKALKGALTLFGTTQNLDKATMAPFIDFATSLEDDDRQLVTEMIEEGVLEGQDVSAQMRFLQERPEDFFNEINNRREQRRLAQLMEVEAIGAGEPTQESRQEGLTRQRAETVLKSLVTQGRLEEAKKLGPIFKQLFPEGSQSVSTFAFPDGSSAQAIRLGDTEAVDKAIAEGKIPLRVETGLSAFEERRQGEAEDISRGQVGVASRAVNLIGDFRRLGRGATGVQRVVGEGLGKIVGQFDGELGDTVTRAISGGVTPEQFAELRIKASSLIAESISTITGEQSGRISEPERRLTERALQLNENLSTPDSVEGAMFGLTSLSLVHAEAQRIKSGKPPLFGATRDQQSQLQASAKLLRIFPNLSNEQIVSIVQTLAQQDEEFKLFGTEVSDGQ